MPSQAVSTTLFPAIAAEPSESARRVTTLLVTRNTLWLTAILGGILFLVASPLVDLLYSSRFAASSAVVRILVPGVVLFSGARVLGNDIAARGRPLVSSTIAAVIVACNIGLNVVLIPRDGIDGQRGPARLRTRWPSSPPLWSTGRSPTCPCGRLSFPRAKTAGGTFASSSASSAVRRWRRTSRPGSKHGLVDPTQLVADYVEAVAAARSCGDRRPRRMFRWCSSVSSRASARAVESGRDKPPAALVHELRDPVRRSSRRLEDRRRAPRRRRKEGCRHGWAGREVGCPHRCGNPVFGLRAVKGRRRSA